MHRGVVAEIDLEAIAANFNAVKSLCGNSAAIAVVKADAYGHGAVEVSRMLVRSGADYLAVAFTEEAARLREAGIKAPIIVLFDPDIEDILKYDLIPVLIDMKSALFVAGEARKKGVIIPVHIKVDTGMGRLGLNGDAKRQILEIASIGGIRIEGVMSHFSESDLADSPFSMHQLNTFRTLRAELTQSGLNVKMYHIANSAGVMSIPESHLDAVRPGLMLYGYSPMQVGASHKITLRPAMTVKARFISLRRLPAGTPISYARTFVTKRESIIGAVSLGYADGFSTKFSNNAEFLVKGKRVPVVGRVCMDLTMVDLTDVGDVTETDKVIVIGNQGLEEIGADDLARRIQVIPYEILTSLGSRAQRRYL